MNHVTYLGLLTVFWSISGCGEAAPDEPVGVAESAAVTGNAIVPNAIVPNAIVPNALVPNALAEGALAEGALDAATRAALQDPGQRGSLSRLFLKYAVGCALDASQSFDLSWTDAANVVHDESYPGDLGIAPTWAARPLTDPLKQRLVSACLAARTNYFGTMVLISIRSPLNPLVKELSSDEIQAYPHVEGAFWGNLFAASPHVYACYEPANVATARAAKRDCAAGHVEPDGQIVPCGPITLTGPCNAACAGLGVDGQAHVYTSCADPSGSSAPTPAVITTALP